MSTHHAALIVITLGAAFVNGALGYGFSSITVPVTTRNFIGLIAALVIGR
jgi:hypothetical protein